MLRHFEKTWFIDNGTKKGKSVLLIGGVHGNELTPLMALVIFKDLHLPLLIDSLRKTDEIKSITIINGINSYGIEKGIRHLENFFQRNDKRDFSELFNHDTYEQTFDPFIYLIEKINFHDIIIDIHSSPSLETNYMVIDYAPTAFPYIKWCQNSNIVFGLHENDNKSISRYSIEKGKIGVTFNLNSVDKIDMNSAKLGASQLSQFLMYYRNQLFETSYQGILRPIIEFKSSETGLFVFPNIFDYEGRIKKNLLNSQTIYNGNGNLLYTSNRSYLRKGDFAFAIQPEIIIHSVEEIKKENEKI
jgi:succinylglutamate desuccinylase